MKELQKLMDDIREWSDSTFGDAQRTIPILHHLKKEVPELISAVKDMQAAGIDNSIGVGEFSHKISVMKLEFADCLMLLLDAASHADIDAEELMKVTKIKLEINKDRKWGKPDENGVVEHIREKQ